MIIFLLSLIPVTRTEIGDGEYFTNMGFIPLFLSFCVCALAYMYFLLGHTHTHTTGAVFSFRVTHWITI